MLYKSYLLLLLSPLFLPLCLCLSLSLSVSVSLCLSLSLSVCLSVALISISPLSVSVFLNLCLSVSHSTSLCDKERSDDTKMAQKAVFRAIVALIVMHMVITTVESSYYGGKSRAITGPGTKGSLGSGRHIYTDSVLFILFY